MKNSNIAQLTNNDTWQQASRKINTNFDNLRKSLEVNVRTGANIDIASLVDIVEARVIPRIEDELFDQMLPVGSIVAFLDSQTPAQHGLRGTWSQVLQDRVLLGAGTAYVAGQNYGSNAVKQHKHDINVSTVLVEPSEAAGVVPVLGRAVSTVATAQTQNSAEHTEAEMLPPSTALTFWRRTA